MDCQQLPRIHLLSKTNLQQDFQHSILISLLRGLAAVEVLAAHLRAQFFPSLRALPDPTLWYQALSFFTGFAHQAVVVFFLLSGWLVGGSLLNKLREPGILLSYAIDRITRLWVVLLPAFVLSLAVGVALGEVDISRVSFALANEYSVTSFMGNLFGLQDMAVPRFGGNFALWSLANEMWYYLLFPLLVLPTIGKTRAPCIAVALLAVGVLVYTLKYDLILYFAVWLLGVGFSRVRIEAARACRAVLLVALLGVAVYFRLTGSNDILTKESFWQDVLFSVVFLVYLSSLQFPAVPERFSTRLARRLGNFLSPFSFTLYVIHVPLLFMMRHWFEPLLAKGLSPDNLGNLVLYIALTLLIIVLAYLFHLPFEAQTPRLRGWIKRMLLRPTAARRFAAA